MNQERTGFFDGDDPFYSEENWKAMIKAKKELDQGKGIVFDIEKLLDGQEISECKSY